MRDSICAPGRATPRAAAEKVVYKVADSPRERIAAFRLVYEAYVQAGLMAANCVRMRVTRHHLLSTSTVFVAVDKCEVVATVSLIGDGALGLPLESIYANEVDQLRGEGLSLGEVSALASRQRQPLARFEEFFQLTRLMAQYARFHGLEHLLAAVHPRHAKFYRRFLGFQPFGKPKLYPSVRNRPAVALLLDLPRLERERHERIDGFFGVPIHERFLRRSPICSAEREVLASAAAWDRGLGARKVAIDQAAVGNDCAWPAA